MKFAIIAAAAAAILLALCSRRVDSRSFPLPADNDEPFGLCGSQLIDAARDICGHKGFRNSGTIEHLRRLYGHILHSKRPRRSADPTLPPVTLNLLERLLAEREAPTGKSPTSRRLANLFRIGESEMPHLRHKRSSNRKLVQMCCINQCTVREIKARICATRQPTRWGWPRS